MIRVSAPAKINPFLEITGKRADGYHTLSIVFQTISLADELTFSPAGDLSLSCSDRSLPTDERNLVMRAAMRLREFLREPRGANIHLKKIVPMGAGLGGGSSDAAAVLRTLPRLWRRPVSEATLHRLARGLGADVPFFLRGGFCAAGGIGDRLRPLPSLPRQWIVLVYPGFGVSTKEAYAKVRLPWKDSIPHPNPLPSRERAGRKAARGEGWSAPLFNRFEELVFPDHPELPKLKAMLAEERTVALMSGSGSAVFGLAASKADAARVLKKIRPIYPQSWLVHTL